MDTNVTTFRQTLIKQLAEVTSAVEINSELVQMKYVEDKGDAIGELLDYYTNNLLLQQNFAAEFDEDELQEIRFLMTFLASVPKKAMNWSAITHRTEIVLASLNGRPPKT